jgi:hypothetical protein
MNEHKCDKAPCPSWWTVGVACHRKTRMKLRQLLHPINPSLLLRETLSFVTRFLSGGDCICLFPLTGCKVESIFLNVAAVNTHRDRPQVAMGSLLGWWACSLGVSIFHFFRTTGASARGSVSLLPRLFSTKAVLLSLGWSCGLVRCFPRPTALGVGKFLELCHQAWKQPSLGVVGSQSLRRTAPQHPHQGGLSQRGPS